VVLLALTLALALVELTQDEDEKPSIPSMGTLQSPAALALDLECLEGPGAARALPYEARCEGPLRFNYRNETQGSRFLGVLFEDDRGQTRHWPKEGMIELPPSGDASRTLKPFEDPLGGSLHVVAFLLHRPEGLETLKVRLQKLDRGEKVANQVLVRRWAFRR
jgi:hypothetical protein